MSPATPARRTLDPEMAKLQDLLDHLGASSGSPRVLEAGCGSLSHVRLDDAYVVGVDISPAQLARHRELDEAVCADIQRWNAPAAAFDLVICWDVLEHLPQPRRALVNLIHTTKPGGLLILALPNVYSIKGLVTKLTPYRFHVWAYRRFWGAGEAASEDRGPFPTYLRLATAPGAVTRLARAHGLEVVYLSAYESLMQKRFRKDHALGNVLLAACALLGRLASCGRLDLLKSDYILVLRKPPAPAGG